MQIIWYPNNLRDIARSTNEWIDAEIIDGDAIFELTDGTVVVAGPNEYLSRSDFDDSISNRTHPLISKRAR
jgi:hypothetical protein